MVATRAPRGLNLKAVRDTTVQSTLHRILTFDCRSNAVARLLPWVVGLGALAALALPTFIDLFHSVWGSDAQGHGPIVLGLSVWLLYRNWDAAMSIDGDAPSPLAAWPLLTGSSLLYAIGRSQSIQLFEVSALIGLLGGLVLLLRGRGAMKTLWFAFFFMLFMVPLPGVVVDTLTQPMKIAVSHVAELILHAAGYPIARWGVILHIGQYQLMVADACAGLTTLFTLEAIGLMYLNVVRHTSATRNVVMAILIVPISFTANVIRVIALTLVTYYFGDEAGQGFLHGFAGIVLFTSALLLIIGMDSLVRWHVTRREALGPRA